MTNSIWDSNDIIYDTTITQTCKHGGHFTDGSTMRSFTCLITGTWSTDVVDCESKTESNQVLTQMYFDQF